MNAFRLVCVWFACLGYVEGIRQGPMGYIAQLMLAQSPARSRSRISTVLQQGNTGRADKVVIMNDEMSQSRDSWFDVSNLPGVSDPLGFFDPVGFTNEASEGRVRFLREVELKHCRLGMLAALGILVAEQFHPMYDGRMDVPAYLAFQETPLQSSWRAVFFAVALLELPTIITFKSPFGSKGEAWSIRHDYEPGNLGFDPLNLKPTDPKELKELNNGRVAMLAATGMIAQELITGEKLFGDAVGSNGELFAGSSLLDKVRYFDDNSAFAQAFLLIFLSELGDKTFFIAALLAAKYSQFISFAGSLGALAIMTLITCGIGNFVQSLPAGLTQGLPVDDYVAVAAFASFGLKTLFDAYQLPDGDSSGMDEERKEAEEEVDLLQREANAGAFLQTFGLVFAAELGDRSFFTTAALSSAQSPLEVFFGGTAAHAVAIAVAVQGGSLMSKYLSEKVIGYIGGTLFLIFAITTGLGTFK